MRSGGALMRPRLRSSNCRCSVSPRPATLPRYGRSDMPSRSASCPLGCGGEGRRISSEECAGPMKSSSAAEASAGFFGLPILRFLRSSWEGLTSFSRTELGPPQGQRGALGG